MAALWAFVVASSTVIAWTGVRAAATDQTAPFPAAREIAVPAVSAGPAAEKETETQTEKDACFARHEDAQRERRQGRLLAARTGLLVCSGASCPAAIRADCIEWLAEVSRSLPSIVVNARARGADLADVRVFIDGRQAVERLTGAALEV